MHAFFALTALLLPLVHAHGYLAKVVANGVENKAPAPWDSYSKMPSTASRIGYNSNKQTKFCLFASDFADASKMSCGPSSNAPAPGTVTVQAGSSVDVYWAGSTGELDSISNKPAGFHPFVHAQGPMLDYLADCNGDCSKFDATNAGWTKMAEAGVDMSATVTPELRRLMAAKPEVYQPKTGAGVWGMAKMIENGSKWTLNIPSQLKPGQYLWRTEMPAMHTSPAQIYVGCVQLTVTGSGTTALPAGVKSNQLYQSGNIFDKFNTYTYDYSKPIAMPGPAVWNLAAGSTQSNSTTVAAGTTDTSSSGTASGSSSAGSLSAGMTGSGSRKLCNKRRSLLDGHRKLIKRVIKAADASVLDH